MKRAIAIFILAVGALLLAQEKSVITVKDSTVATGVVIIDAQMAGKAVELQCNHGAPSCTALKRGTYVMLQLPKNRGLYDCRCVRVYAEGDDPESAEILGEYCLIEK